MLGWSFLSGIRSIRRRISMTWIGMNCYLIMGYQERMRDYDADDPDANLIPVLVEKDRECSFATNLLINYIPASSEGLRELLAVVRSRLDEAIAGLSVPTWSALVLKAVPGAAQLAAYQFGMSLRLLRNICLWKDVLALPILEKLALDDLLGKKLLPHVRSIMRTFMMQLPDREDNCIAIRICLSTWYLKERFDPCHQNCITFNRIPILQGNLKNWIPGYVESCNNSRNSNAFYQMIFTIFKPE
ncbi:hypothetical protein J5N97_011636 [Dioscorea zingiberensis]|uniref:GCF C-terminal domain-containing protein n=1 Tax=Dioscorea zingiberensis TaxID=325984 RepID=A0A9D5D1E6_9LILI|nr:hypothetical protein J5N97_011636 [Dioscorea zingiberensis]